ncbi:MAG: hypothetical protein L0Y56_21555, partial [Nitrospira sp.]|nr:hypothetical protein [Nitrospira sp.]
KMLNSQIPHDVDKSFKAGLSLTDPYQLAEAQRLHDIFSWQSFLAINWPVDDNGKPKAAISDPTGVPQWATWINSHDVFKPDGSAPEWRQEKQLERFLTSYQKGNFITDPNLSAHIDVNQPDDVDQAFSSPLWDQNGNIVHYEIIMNHIAFDYIDKNQLYNRDGQIEYYQANKDHRFVVSFPWGNSEKADSVGTIMLKLAWKLIDEERGDIPDRYYIQNATMLTPDPANPGQVLTVTGKVGLVGMHIVHRTFSSGEWIWSTFEHVDNLQVNNLELMEFQGKQQPLKPSFYDPTCETCPVNIPPETDENGLRRTQVVRAIPIAEATAALNQQMQQLLREAGSVWQYYELIGTQWSTQPDSPPDTVRLRAIRNESGGHPSPVYLTNSVMETYFQKGNQPLKDLTGHNQEDMTLVFGTASCMGCHSNAPITAGEESSNGKRTPVPGNRRSAEFSWSLWTKANWDSTKPTAN